MIIVEPQASFRLAAANSNVVKTLITRKFRARTLKSAEKISPTSRCMYIQIATTLTSRIRSDHCVISELGRELVSGS